MTERSPIVPDQIQAGDLIRFEWTEPDLSPHNEWAAEFLSAEYRATKDGASGGWDLKDGTYYLLSRPTRPDTPVPFTPTLGWLMIKGQAAEIGVWQERDYSMRDGVGRSVLQHERDIRPDQVEGFVRAVPIPPSAAHGLADSLLELHQSGAINLRTWPQAAAFVAAVDQPAYIAALGEDDQ